MEAAGVEPAHSAKVFIDIHAYASYGLRRRFMAHAGADGVQVLYREYHNRISFTERSTLQLGLIPHLKISSGIEAG